MAGEQERLDASVEGQGASVGEAKWAAIKTLERRFPGVAAEHVDFEVLDQGDEPGGRPARVDAEVDLGRWRAAVDALPDDPAERVRAFVVRVVQAFELRASVDLDENDEEI